MMTDDEHVATRTEVERLEQLEPQEKRAPYPDGPLGPPRYLG